jgi:osmotically inducible protein OsmC
VTVSLASYSTTGLDLTVKIDGELPGVDRGTAREFFDQAHAIGPYSRATSGNITQDVTLVD